MNITIPRIKCIEKHTVPRLNSNIMEHFDLDLYKIRRCCDGINIYRRDQENSPNGRGNWIVDLTKGHQIILTIRLPFQMQEAHVYQYCRDIIGLFQDLHLDNQDSFSP